MIFEYLNYYFGQYKDEKVIYFFGKDNSANTLFKVLDMHYFKEFLIVFEDDNDKSKVDVSTENNCKVISKEETKNYNDYVVVLDHYKNFTELSLKSKKLVGSYPRDFDTYEVWKHFKDSVEEILIAKEGERFNQVLKWKRNPKSDVELSVIFPVYKVAQYLDKCLESITKWDAPYVEYVFVNDGSPDNSAQIIEEWSKKDPRVKLLNKENGGCASARQCGLEHSSGRYIGFIDPDDFIDPTMFKKLHSAAMKGNYDVAYCGYNEFYEDTQTSKPVRDLLYDPYVGGTADEKALACLISDLRIAIWRGIYKRKLLENNNIKFHTELKRFDDLPFKVEVYSKAHSVYCVPEHLYYYRLGRAGQDVSANDERLYVHFEIFKILDDYFKDGASSLQLKKYYKVKVQTHYWAVTTIKSELKEEYKKTAAVDLNIENTGKSWKKLLSRYFRRKDVRKFFKR